MNNTKKITQGALLLAITGALMYLNLRMAGLFDTFVILIIPIVIAIYSTMNELRDGMVLSVSMGILGLVLGFALTSPTYIIYFPVCVLTGIAYSWGIKKGLTKRKLLMIAIIAFVVGEILASFIFFPLFGIKVEDELKLMSEMFTNTDYSQYGEYGAIMNASVQNMLKLIGDHLGTLILLLFIFSTVLVGVMEGVIIHILTVFLLRRFRIKELPQTSLYDMKPNVLLTYLSMASVFAMFFLNRVGNDDLYAFVICLSLTGAIILIYYGYLFLVLYSRIVLRRNITFFLIPLLLFAAGPLVFLLLILGFLYGSGPLRRYLESKVESKVDQA